MLLFSCYWSYERRQTLQLVGLRWLFKNADTTKISSIWSFSLCKFCLDLGLRTAQITISGTIRNDNWWQDDTASFQLVDRWPSPLAENGVQRNSRVGGPVWDGRQPAFRIHAVKFILAEVIHDSCSVCVTQNIDGSSQSVTEYVIN